MFCSNCGKELKEGADICVNCGKLVHNNTTNNVVNQNKNGMATASLVLGIFAIITSFFALLIAITFTAYYYEEYTYHYIYDSYMMERVLVALFITALPLLLSIIGFCLGLASRSKSKSGSSIAGLILNILSIVLCIISFVLITG